MNVRVALVSGFGAPDLPKSLGLFYSRLLQPYKDLGYPATAGGMPLGGLCPIENAIDDFEKKLLADDDGSQFILFGHSKGSLVVAGFANRYPNRVLSLKFLAPPWYGTQLVRAWMPIPGVRVMSAASRWLTGQHHHDTAFPVEKIDSFFTVFDPLVVPATASIVKGGNNYMLVPPWLEGMAMRAGRSLVGEERMSQVHVLHGLAEHVTLATHPAICKVVQEQCAPTRHLAAVA